MKEQLDRIERKVDEIRAVLKIQEAIKAAAGGVAPHPPASWPEQLIKLEAVPLDEKQGMYYITHRCTDGEDKTSSVLTFEGDESCEYTCPICGFNVDVFVLGVK